MACGDIKFVAYATDRCDLIHIGTGHPHELPARITDTLRLLPMIALAAAPEIVLCALVASARYSTNYINTETLTKIGYLSGFLIYNAYSFFNTIAVRLGI
jgi:hypothetical protein